MNKFRILSMVEGCSLLLLLFVAMPAKYYFGIREAVFYVGITHGMLFLSYGIASLVVSHQQKWSVGYWLFVFLAGVVPFGFLATDKKLKQAVSAQQSVMN